MNVIENQRSLRAIVGDVADDVRALIRGELALARAEFDQKLDRLITGLITVVGAMLLGFAGLVVALLAGAEALSIVIPAWAALLCIGVVIMVIGGGLAYGGMKALSVGGLVPERTARNVQADARVVKEHVT